MTDEIKQKYDLILAHYKISKNYAATGRVFNLTRERIRQIVQGKKRYPQVKKK